MTVPTDAYREWLAAHPDLDALDDREKDHEAALAMGKPVCDDPECPGCDTEVIATPEGLRIDGGPWSPTTDAAQAVEFAQDTAKNVRVTRSCQFALHLGSRDVGVSVWAFGEPRAIGAHASDTFPAALTTACLAARRAMMKRDA